MSEITNNLQAIELFVRNQEKLDLTLHQLAYQALQIAYNYGDVSMCQRVAYSVRPDFMRYKKIKKWFQDVGPIVIGSDKWCLKKGWNKANFQLEVARNNPF